MSDYKQWNLSKTGIAFDPHTGESFQLNEAAQKVLLMLRQEHSPEETAKKLAEDFGIPYEQAITDVMQFQVEIGIIQSAA